MTLAAGTSKTVTLYRPASQLATYQGAGWTTVPGTYTVGVGDSSASQPTHAVLTVMH